MTLFTTEMNGKQSATKRCRTRFNTRQLQRLEQVFIKTHYPDGQQMEILSIETEIPASKMQIWFQNRRAKWRKNSRLKNFGGLASVSETEYLPAPHISDTLKSLSFDSNYKNCAQNDKLSQTKSNENKAIDLRLGSMSDCRHSSHTVSSLADKSMVYTNSGGIISHRLNEQMNEFEYPTAYYGRHRDYSESRGMVSLTVPFASNQMMTSLLFASHLYRVCIQSDSECDSNIQNIDFNK